ncbi:MAG: hypothetical protein Kow0069_17100 [Promethearchaeota archaeon]
MKVKIPGTGYHVEVVAKDVDFVLELTRQGKHVDFLRVPTTDDLGPRLAALLDERGVEVPSNRLRSVLDALEEQASLLEEEERGRRAKGTLDSLLDSTREAQLKIVLLGLAGAGKTSIYLNLFEGKEFWEIRDLAPTRGVQRRSPGARGNGERKLYVWDVGGQERYVKEHHENPGFLFSGASGVVFVVDASDAGSLERAAEELQWALARAGELAPEAKFHVFVHKMDLFQDREHAYDKIRAYLSALPGAGGVSGFHATSVLDASVVAAWASFMEEVLPKSRVLNVLAEDLKQRLGAYNILLIEKHTGLPVCSSKLQDGLARGNRTASEDEYVKLTGLMNKFIVTVGRLAEELDLVNLQAITVELGNGIVWIREVIPGFLLMVVTDSKAKVKGNQAEIDQFVEKVRIHV